MLNTPFSPWPSFTAEEARAVQDVVLSNKVNYWTGTECREFETEFAAWVGVKHAVALANGTLALDVALRSLGIGAGDEVVVTPRTFIASISCVVNAGAEPVFADVEADSGNISAITIARVLTPRTKAIICVHLAGWPCDMDPIMALAQKHGLKVIEDCAQAHAAQYKGRSVGSIGHIGAWSFCQDKIITTGGEGGMVTTNDEALWSAMWSFKDHGKNYDAVFNRQHPPGFRWVHESFGTNWRMLEMQAVIGRIQLRRLAEWTVKRTRNADAIWAACRPYVVVRVPVFGCNPSTTSDAKTVGDAQGTCEARSTSDTQSACDAPCAGHTGCRHAHYKCFVYVQSDKLAQGWSRDRIARAINSLGVPCYQGTCSEVYLEKAFDGTRFRPAERLPGARALGDSSLMFLVHPTLTQAEIELTCAVIGQVLSEATARAHQPQHAPQIAS